MTSMTTITAAVVCTSSHTPQVDHFTPQCGGEPELYTRNLNVVGCCSTKPVHTVVNEQLPLNSLSVLLGPKPTLFLSGFSVMKRKYEC